MRQIERDNPEDSGRIWYDFDQYEIILKSLEEYKTMLRIIEEYKTILINTRQSWPRQYNIDQYKTILTSTRQYQPLRDYLNDNE